MTFEDYVDCDRAAATSTEPTTKDIVKEVREQKDCSDEDDTDTVSRTRRQFLAWRL